MTIMETAMERCISQSQTVKTIPVTLIGQIHIKERILYLKENFVYTIFSHQKMTVTTL